MVKQGTVCVLAALFWQLDKWGCGKTVCFVTTLLYVNHKHH
jgi:hypothetical protein